jgi:hypothetical protein
VLFVILNPVGVPVWQKHANLRVPTACLVSSAFARWQHMNALCLCLLIVMVLAGTTILKGLDDIQMLLDDQLVKTQSMRASPYIGPFEDRVKLWEAKLNLTQVKWLQAAWTLSWIV